MIDKKKRIAFINDTFLEGRGADTVIYELARRLGKKYEVFVISGDSNIAEENFKLIKIYLPKLFTGRLKDFFYFNKMKKLKEQVDRLDKEYSFNKIFVCHGGLSPAFDKNNKINYIWMGSPSSKNLFRNLLAVYFKIKMKKNKIITISKFMKKDLEKINASNIQLTLLGVSSEFKDIKKDKNFMLYVGRLERHKNVIELINLAKKINFQLKIIGYGPEKEDLEKFAKKINSPAIFLGKVSKKELIKNYQECSFFVSGSKWEGFGLIFIEAAACGKPSIGYNKGSIAEVIIDGKTGFVVNKPEEFEKKAKILLENKKIRKLMGQRASKDSKRYNWDRIVYKLEKDL